MDESEFWPSLEYRVCREFAGMSDLRLRSYWCDGFIPREYVFGDARPRVTGKSWICKGHHQSEWDFVLLLPQSTHSEKQIDWTSLLPPEDETKWLSFDEHKKQILIEYIPAG